MNDIHKAPVDSKDLAGLLCLLRSYEHYGNQSALPACLAGLGESAMGRS